jgi:hypothetical protein
MSETSTHNAFEQLLGRNGSSLYDKIWELFTERLVDENVVFCGLRKLDARSLILKLHRIQLWVYMLDQYGEENWEIDKQVLGRVWAEIHTALNCLVTRDVARGLVGDIKRYQNIEIGLRCGRSPLTIPLAEFYSMKTCDVRMIRQLIDLNATYRCPKALHEMWRLYDLVSEVLDDLCDIEEDQRTFNCNRFVMELKARGLQATRDNYTTFMYEMCGVADQVLREGGMPYGANYVYERTVSRIGVVLCMLEQVDTPSRSERVPELGGGKAELITC